VVLALMPLILQVLQHYPDFSDSAGNSRNPSELMTGLKSERKSFVVLLRTVYVELLSFLHEIITDSVVLSNEQRNALFPFDHDRSEFLIAWNDLWTRDHTAIMKGLGKAENSYQMVVEDLMSIQQTILNMTPSKSSVETFAKVIMSDRANAIQYLKENLSPEFKFTCRSTERQKIGTQLEGITKILAEKLCDSSELPPSNRVKERFPNTIETRRRFSAILYNCLGNFSNCSCHKFQSTMLQLDRTKYDAKDDAQNLQFSIIFKFKPVGQRQQLLPDVQETDVDIRQTYELSNSAVN
jgi:hypothetical protein